MPSISNNYGQRAPFIRKITLPVNKTAVTSGTEATPSTTAETVGTTPTPATETTPISDTGTTEETETSPVEPSGTEPTPTEGYDPNSGVNPYWMEQYGNFLGLGSTPSTGTTSYPCDGTVSFPTSTTSSGTNVDINFGNGWGMHNNSISVGNTGVTIIVGGGIPSGQDSFGSTGTEDWGTGHIVFPI